MAVQDRLRDRMVNCTTHLFKVTEHPRIEYASYKEILRLARMLRGELRQHPDINSQAMDTCSIIVESALVAHSPFGN